MRDHTTGTLALPAGARIPPRGSNVAGKAPTGRRQRPRSMSFAGAPSTGGITRTTVSPRGLARFGLEFDDGSVLVVRGRGLIGRDPAAPAGERATHYVTLSDPARRVSRTHLEFGVADSGLWVVDHHSTNGSVIEFSGQRRRVEPGRAVRVRPTSTIYLGGQRILVRTIPGHTEIGPVTVEWGAASSVGVSRESNQDSFGADPPVFIVADGIGGHSGGDVASREAVQALQALTVGQPVTVQTINNALAHARSRIAQIPVREGDRPPGTTLSGVIVTHSDQVPYWLVMNIGDSRTYRLDTTGLRQLTKDHSLIQELVDKGLIAQDARHRPPFRNILRRAVTAADEHAPDVWWLPINVRDRIMVCSDGLCSSVDNGTIHRLLATLRDPHTAANALVDTAIHFGAKDDVTAVVVDAVAIQGRR